MARGKAIWQQTLSKASQGDVSALRRLKDLYSRDKSSPETIDIIFQILTGSSVPAIPIPHSNLPQVAIACARPAAALAFLWKMVAMGVGEDVEDAFKRSIAENCNVLCRWSLFCLQTGHNSLPEDLFEGDPSSRQEQDLIHARLLLQLLDLDPVYAQEFLCCEGFSELFREIWYTDGTADGSLATRSPGARVDEACPVVLLAHRFVKDEVAREAFLERCSKERHCVEFSVAMIDRVRMAWEGPGVKEGGYLLGSFETLRILIEIADIMWTSSDPYHSHLRERGFLEWYGNAFNDVSSTLVEQLGFSPVFTAMFPPLIRLIMMSLNDLSHAGVRSNWARLDKGEFWESFTLSLSVAATTEQIWKPMPRILPILSTLLTYPSLIPTSVDLSSVKPLGGSEVIESWDAFARGFRISQKAKALIQSIADPHMCGNLLCSNLLSTRAESQCQQCERCSSVAYCSAACQSMDWEQFHRNECHFAQEIRNSRDASGTLCSLKTRVSQARLLDVAFQENKNLASNDASIITVLDFTAISANSLDNLSYNHQLLGNDTYWDRRGSPFAQEYLRDRLERPVDSCKAGAYSHGCSLVEGIFPQFGGEMVVHLTVLLKPVDQGFRTVYCISRDRLSTDSNTGGKGN